MSAPSNSRVASSDSTIGSAAADGSNLLRIRSTRLRPQSIRRNAGRKRTGEKAKKTKKAEEALRRIKSGERFFFPRQRFSSRGSRVPGGRTRFAGDGARRYKR